jgi:hypothetical protein
MVSYGLLWSCHCTFSSSNGTRSQRARSTSIGFDGILVGDLPPPPRRGRRPKSRGRFFLTLISLPRCQAPFLWFTTVVLTRHYGFFQGYGKCRALVLLRSLHSWQ